MDWASQCRFCQAVTVAENVDTLIKPMCHSTPSTVHPRQQNNKTASKTQRQNKVHCQHDIANHVFQCTGSSTSLMRIKLSVNGVTLPLELDTGASVLLISEKTYLNTWLAKKRPPLQPSNSRLYTYSGELIQVLGTISFTAHYKDQVKQRSLLVVPTDGPSLFGRDWLHTIILDWKQLICIHHVHH